MTEISNSDKIISVSDITARVDELREERTEHDQNDALTGASVDEDGLPAAGTWEVENTDDAEELEKLLKLLDDLRGRGTSHDWGGDTYPDSLIADHHFSEYIEESAYDMGAVQRGVSWIVIDWDATANAVKQDYRSVDFDGAEYWHRA